MRIPTVSALPKYRDSVDITYRYVGSPNNSFVIAISGTRGLVGPALTTPQTDAALSPRLLEILQYREPTHKRTLSNTTPLNDDRRTAISDLPERPASTAGDQTPKQHAADGIMQRLGVAGQGRNGPPVPTRSETLDTIDTDVFWSTAPTILHQENVSQAPSPGGSTSSKPELAAIIPKIRVHAGNSLHSEASSFTIVDSSEPTPTDTRINRRTRDATNNRGYDDAGSDRGTSDSRISRGDSSVRKASDGSSGKTEQQHLPPGQRPGTHNHDPPALPSFKTNSGPAVLHLHPIEQTPSRSSSIRKKGKRTILICDQVP